MPPRRTSRPRYQGLAAARGRAPASAPPRDPFTLAVGERVGDLTVIGHLASGRTAELYQVWSTEHWCALTGKLALPGSHPPARMPDAMMREAEVLGVLDHPNIVRLFGSGVTGGRGYLLMEYLNGPTLFELLESTVRRRLLVPDAIRAVMHIGSAIHYLHRSGYLYRDLKPGNIMLREGVPVLVDFDVVERFEALDPPPDRLGTGPYMAPEQVRKRPLSAASDVYGLGALLYELLTGHWPTDHPGDDDLEEQLWMEEVADASLPSGFPERADDIPSDELDGYFPQLAHPAVPPRKHNPQVPIGLERVVLRCLEADPAGRFRTVSGLLAALAPLLKGPHRLWPETAPVERRIDTESR